MKKIIQFGFNVKVPDGIPLLDCRVIPNPHKIPDPVAQRYAVRSHPEFPKLVAKGVQLLEENDVIGIGCAYGVHRSGMVVEQVERGTAHEVEVEKIGKA